MLLEPDSLQALLAAPASGEGAVLTLEKGQFAPVDSSRFYSNVPAEVFKSRVLGNTVGKFFFPPKKVFRLNNARMSPLIPNRGRWPEIMYIHTNEGTLAREVLQRWEKASNAPYQYKDPERVSGTCVYLGMFMPYFGHFLSEVVSRFWLCDALRDMNPTYVFHALPSSIKAWNTDTRMTQWVESVMNDFGITRDKVSFITRDTEFEDVICPMALNVYTHGYNPGYRKIAERIKASMQPLARDTPKRIFLSRSRFKGRNLINAAQIEAIFQAYGFTVVHPQEHDFATQIAMAANADIIAGEEGSAMCNVMFAENPVIIELESGRFHRNLPRLSSMMARRYCYILPYRNSQDTPRVHMKTKLYANPWVVNESLAEILGTAPLGEDICGPRLCADVYERAFTASQNSDLKMWLECMDVISARFPEWITWQNVEDLKANFNTSGAAQPILEALGI